jgi:predicted  nucleic acid-binding Zn-ribbon protein
MGDEQKFPTTRPRVGGTRDLTPIPSIKFFLTITPLFILVLALQTMDIKHRAESKEASLNNESVISRVTQAKEDFEKQAAGWTSLVDSYQTRLDDLQAGIARNEAQMAAVSEKKIANLAEAAKVQEQLEMLESEIATAHGKLTQAKEEFERVSVRKTDLDVAYTKSDIEMTKQKTAQMTLQAEYDRLSKELATQQEVQKTQAGTITVNQNVIRDLESKKTELAGLNQEIKTSEVIATALKKEVQRLETRRTELDEEIRRKESEIQPTEASAADSKTEAEETSP